MDYCSLYNQTYSSFTPDWLEGENLIKSKQYINDNCEGLINFFESYVKQFHLEDKLQFMNVLELGCGLGGFSQYLAKRVMSVTALDVSSLAIANAKEYAQVSGVHVNYLVQNVAVHFDLNEKFDLVIDSHLLHCLTSVSDRSLYLENVKRHMKDDCIFIAETMVFQNDLEIPIGYSFDANSILHQEIESTSTPVRAIYKTLEIENEITDSGFKINYFYYHNELSFSVFSDYEDYPIKYLPKTLRFSATSCH